MLDVVADRLRADPEARGDRLVGAPPAQLTQHLDLARGEAARTRRSADASVSGRRDHGLHRLRVEPSRCRVTPQLACRGVLVARRTVRTVLGHRVEGVRGREQARGPREQWGREMAVVAGSVQPFVVRCCEQTHAPERLRPGEDAFHVVGVQLHALAVTCTERPRGSPHLSRYAEPSDVVHECSAPHEAHVVRIKSQGDGGAFCEARGPDGVTCEERAAKVAEVADRGERLIELVVVQRWAHHRLEVDHVGLRDRVELPHQVLGVAIDHVDEPRVELRSAPGANEVDGLVGSDGALQHLRSLGDLRDARCEADSFA